MQSKKVSNKASIEAKTFIGMEELHHRMNPITEDTIDEIVDSFEEADAEDEIDEICDTMLYIQEHESGVRNFILYNAHTVLRMSDYLISKYYTVLKMADSNSVVIPDDTLADIKNNVRVLLEYMEGIDLDNAMDWFVKFLLVGFDPHSDNIDASKAKEAGKAIIKFADEEDAE